MMRQVVCPVVRRGPDVLAFRHPLAGHQLVKGGIEPHETPKGAAVRELFEEAGVAGTIQRLGPVTEDIQPGERWHFVEMMQQNLPDAWCHRTSDGGGLEFSFFWFSPDAPRTDFDPRYRRALDVIGGMA